MGGKKENIVVNFGVMKEVYPYVLICQTGCHGLHLDGSLTVKKGTEDCV